MIYLISILSAIVLFFLFFIVPTFWVKTTRVKNNLNINKKILQLSDLHMERLRVSPNQIKKIIDKEKPDYIFITGDFLDQKESIKKLILYLEVIKESKIPTYAVLGNHDYMLEKPKSLIKVLRSYNVTVLNNNSIEFKDFYLIGIDDYCSEHHDVKKSFQNVKNDKKKVVITHDPNIVLDMNEKFDYLLSGHLHGKQVWVPYLFHFKRMGDLPLQGIYTGLHKDEKGSFYISNGLGQSGLNIRFLVRSEVVIHEV